MTPKTKTFDEVLAAELAADSQFRADWQRLALAREFADALLRYRTDHGLSQRGLARRLGVSQPRVAKLESAEHNPEIDTLIRVARRLGIEFCLDIAPAGRTPRLMTKRAQTAGAVEHDAVAVFAASE